MESKSDTSAPILDREVSDVASLVIIFDQRYRVRKVATKANWKHTLRNILSTNEDSRMEVIQAFDILHQTSVPQQETSTKRHDEVCVP